MRAASQEALDRARDRWEAVLRESSGSETEFGIQLFAVADLFRGEGALCRALNDANRSSDDRGALASRLLDGKVGGCVRDLVGGLVRERWAQDADLLDALEELGVDSVLAGAQRRKRLGATEEELYRLMRLLADERSLRLTLSDESLPASRRVRLASSLWAQSLGPETLALALRAVERVPLPTLASSLRAYVDAAAARQSRLVAAVTVASPLSRAQEERLTRILSAKYGGDVSLHVSVSPDVVGGMRIRIGDDVVDATLATRIKGVSDAIGK